MFYRIVTCVLVILSLQFISAVSAKVARADCGTAGNPCSGGEIQGWQPDGGAYGAGGAQSPPPGNGWQSYEGSGEDFHAQQACGSGGIRCPGYPQVIMEMDANSRQPSYEQVDPNLVPGVFSNDLQMVPLGNGNYLWQGENPVWMGEDIQSGSETLHQQETYYQSELGQDGIYHQKQYPDFIYGFNGQVNPSMDYYQRLENGQFMAPVLPDPAASDSNDEVIWY